MTPGVERLLGIVAERWRLDNARLLSLGKVDRRDVIYIWALISTLFDDPETEQKWLDTPQLVLRNNTPRELLVMDCGPPALLVVAERITGW